MNRKSFFCAAFFSCGMVLGAFAQSVNEAELRSAGGEGAVVFENYEGPHSVVESAASISAIGSSLGERLKNAGTGNAGTFGANEKYTVIHAVDPAEEGKLDADIITINANATVDHIRNLRRIIASYLQSAYGYSPRDAATVATFTTVYNAVYRQKIDVFNSKYKKIVTQNLDAKKCGLSLKWSEWPGASQIVIPLGEYSEGGLSSVDTSIISDKNVVESMRGEDDKGIDDRKNMVDIKERESEEAGEKAKESAKTAAEEKQKLDEQKEAQKQAEKTADQKQKEADSSQKTADQKQKEADDAKKKADEAKQASKDDPNNRQKAEEAKQAEKKSDQKQKEADSAQKTADEKQKEADDAKKSAKDEQKKTEEQQKSADDAAKKAEEQQKAADKKQDEAQKERAEIARDQQEVLQQELKVAEDGTVIGLKVVDENDYLSSLVKVNATTGQLVKESPVKVIRGRTIIAVQDAVLNIATGAAFPKTSGNATFYMAICGDSKGTVKLCLIDAYKMEIQKESEEKVSKHSVLVANGSNYYCVIEGDDGWNLGRYDKSLNLIQKSEIKVSESTPITFTPKGIIVTNEKNVPVLLSLADMSIVEK